MNTIILTLQTTSKTADPVKKTGILMYKSEIAKIFKQEKDAYVCQIMSSLIMEGIVCIV